MKTLLCYLVPMFMGYVGIAQTVNINLTSPTTYQLTGDVLGIQASITSTYQVDSVIVTVGSLQTNLTYNATVSAFTGQLNISALVQDTLILNIRAKDVYGNQQTLSRNFIHDLPPVIIIDSPAYYSVARPLINFKARAVDNKSGVQLQVAVYPVLGIDPNLGTYMDSIQTTYDLTYYDGLPIYITVSATDSRGQKSGSQIYIFVESSPYLEEYCSAPTKILDFNYNKVLASSTYDRSTKIVNISNGNILDVPQANILYDLDRAKNYVTTDGAILVEGSQGRAPYKDTILDIHNGIVDPILVDYGPALNVAGNYATWENGSSITKLYLRNLVTHTDTLIANDGAAAIVSSNGNIVYGDNARNIYFYKNGSPTQIGNTAGSTINFSPLTDGNYAVYSKATSSNSAPFSLYMYDGTTTSDLVDLGNYQPKPYVDYQVNNKFIAYTKPAPTGQTQVWLRDSTGANKQITFFGIGSQLQFLNQKGEMMIVENASLGKDYRRYFSDKDGNLKNISYGTGTNYYRDSSWYIAIGRVLFRVNLTIAPNIVHNSAVSTSLNTPYSVQTPDFASNFTGPGQLINIKITGMP